MECFTHGVRQVRVPWAEPGSQFTALFERWAMDLLRECSVKGAAGLLRISQDEAWGIKGRAVRRGLARRTQGVVAHLGVDEKAITKRHRSLTVVADLGRSHVLSLADDRQQESLDGFWATLIPEQLARIQAVATDMWEPCVQFTRAHLPEAEARIVFDRFHVAKHAHEALDAVWKAEHRVLKQAGAGACGPVCPSSRRGGLRASPLHPPEPLAERAGPPLPCGCAGGGGSGGQRARERHREMRLALPMLDGREGEVGVSTLTREGLRLVRYRAHDLTRVLNRERCDCGHTHLRIDRLRGRTDDMVVFRGVNFYPRQAEQLVLETPGVSHEHQIQLDRGEGGDWMTHVVEVILAFRAEEGERLRRKLRDLLGLNPKLSVVKEGEIPRPFGKAVRVLDQRRTP